MTLFNSDVSHQILQKSYWEKYIHPVLSSFLSFSIPNVLCDPTDLIWRYGTPFETMNGCTAFVDGLLADVFRDFPQLKGKCLEICAQPPVSYHPYLQPIDVTDLKLGTSSLWLRTRTGAATLAYGFFGRSLWLHVRKKKYI